LKIENSIKATAIAGEAPAAKSGQKAPAAAAAGGDSIELSAQLKNLEKNLSSSEVFDAARVAEIKQAISQGRFAVNPEKVADQLLETVRDLIQGRQR
jgi:negative regulator of flagellin synthesis FlgM